MEGREREREGGRGRGREEKGTDKDKLVAMAFTVAMILTTHSGNGMCTLYQLGDGQWWGGLPYSNTGKCGSLLCDRIGPPGSATEKSLWSTPSLTQGRKIRIMIWLTQIIP